MQEYTKKYLVEMVTRSLTLYQELLAKGKGDATIEGTVQRFLGILKQLNADVPLTKRQRKTLRENLRSRINLLTTRIIPEYSSRIAAHPAEADTYKEYKTRAESLAETLRKAVVELS